VTEELRAQRGTEPVAAPAGASRTSQTPRGLSLYSWRLLGAAPRSVHGERTGGAETGARRRRVGSAQTAPFSTPQPFGHQIVAARIAVAGTGGRTCGKPNQRPTDELLP
jgi:hypothetical protein